MFSKSVKTQVASGAGKYEERVTNKDGKMIKSEMTIEQKWSYGKDRGESFSSHIVGNVQYLYGKDNINLTSGATKDEVVPTGTIGSIVEVDANDKDSGEIFELEVQDKEEDSVKYTYRAWRLPLYPIRE